MWFCEKLVEGEFVAVGDGLLETAAHALDNAGQACVKGHLGAIEVVPFQGGLERGGVGVAGDADGTGDFLVGAS